MTILCLLYIIHCILNIFLIRFIEYKLFTQGLCTSMLCRWVLSTIATSKAPWDKIDAQVKVVNYTSLQWTIDTCHRIIDSQRAPKRHFFSIAHSAMQFGKRHVTYDAEWQQNDPSSNVSWPPWMNQTTFQLCMPGGLNLDIHILILINIYIYYLNLYNNIYIWTSCTLRHIAGLIKQWQMYVDKCTLLDKYTIDHFWTFLTGKPYPALEAPENNCLSSSVKADKHTKLQQSNHATQRFWWIRRHMFKMQKSKNKSN